MKKLIIFLTLISLIAILIAPVHSQEMKKLGQTGMQFLRVDVGARATTMGGAFMMVGDDAEALFYNPAGIAYMGNSIDLFVSQTSWIADIKYNVGGLVKNLGNWGTVGVSAIFADYSGGTPIWGTRVDMTSDAGYEDTGELDVGAYAIGISYARRLTNKFSIGGQIKLASQHLGSNLVEDGSLVENKVTGTAYDFGTIFYPGFKSLRLGMSIRNFSPEFKYEEEAFELPLTFTLGFAMDVLDFMGDEHEHSLLLSVDAIHPRDYSERLNVGAEFWFMDILALRAGYKYNYDEEGLTGGVGFKYSMGGLGVKIGYSYSPMDVFDSVNRISIGLSL